MKRLLLFLATTALFVSCGDKLTWVSWWIENDTGEDITITPPPFSDARTTIGRETRMSLYENYYQSGEKLPDFEEFIRRGWRSWPPEDIYIEVTCNGKTIRWNYSDKDLPGKQLFNESSWMQGQSSFYGEAEESDIFLSFKITPEDFQ